MGTNYYVIQRNDYKKYMSMLDHINTINFDKLKEELNKLILKSYKDVINLLNEKDINKIKEIIFEKTSYLKTSLALEINFKGLLKLK